MPSSTEVRSGLKFGWTLGESGWNAEMDANLLRIGRFGFHSSIKDRDLATPPGSPTAGDAYIVAASPTGAWVGHTGEIAIYYGTSWVFSGAPRKGWKVYVEDEDIEATYVTSWQTGDNKNGVGYQVAPTAKTANATLTIAELLTKIITATSASAVALTLPTGTLTDAGLSMQIDTAFDWGVINLGSASGAVTMTAGTDHTYVGNATVAIGDSGKFRTRKTAANTFVTYRIS